MRKKHAYQSGSDFIFYPFSILKETPKQVWSEMSGIALTWKIIGITDHEGDFLYLAYCSNANWTTIPTRYGARVADAAGPVQGQTKPIVTIGIIRLSTRAATEDIRCPKWVTRVLLVPVAESGSIGLLKWSIRRTNTATPQ